MRGNCGECERRYFCEIDPDKCNEWPDAAPQTNADRIRAMSDEELSLFLWFFNRDKIARDESGVILRPLLTAWLKQPAE